MLDTHTCCFFFQAEDGIRDLVRSRGLGDVYKRQTWISALALGALVALGGCSTPKVTDYAAQRPVLDLSLIHI